MNLNYLAGILAFGFAAAVQAAPESFEIRIKNHHFTRQEVTVKADQTFELVIVNEDASSEEFESMTAMRVEKFIGPKRTIRLILGPLKPGSYDFFGEFHQATAKGKVIAR